MNQWPDGFTELKDIAGKKWIDLESELVSREITQADIVNAIEIHLTHPHINEEADEETQKAVSAILGKES